MWNVTKEKSEDLKLKFEMPHSRFRNFSSLQVCIHFLNLQLAELRISFVYIFLHLATGSATCYVQCTYLCCTIFNVLTAIYVLLYTAQTCKRKGNDQVTSPGWMWKPWNNVSDFPNPARMLHNLVGHESDCTLWPPPSHHPLWGGGGYV